MPFTYDKLATIILAPILLIMLAFYLLSNINFGNTQNTANNNDNSQGSKIILPENPPDSTKQNPSKTYLEKQRAIQKSIIDEGRIKVYFHLTGDAKEINKDFVYENEPHKALIPVNPQEYWESIPLNYSADATIDPELKARKLPSAVTLKTVWTLIWDDSGKWVGYDPDGKLRTPKEPALFLELWDASPVYGQNAYAVSLSLSDAVGETRPLPTWTHLIYIDGEPLDDWTVPYGKIYWNVRLWSHVFRLDN